MTMNKTLGQELKKGKCVPCEGGTQPFRNEDEELYLTVLEDWQLNRTGEHRIEREIKVKNFVAGLALVNKIGQVAEAQGHHPNLYLHDYKWLKIELYTHAIGGLSLNDFIMAAKIDELLK